MEEEKKTSSTRRMICDIMSKMLDNPDKGGIYPTTIAYNELEELIKERQIEAIGWAYALACTYLDKGMDIRSESVPNILDEWTKASKG